MSKEIWLIGEAVTSPFSKNTFLSLFMNDRSGKLDEAQIYDLFWVDSSTGATPTEALWMILLDMNQNPELYGQNRYSFTHSQEMSLMRNLKTQNLIRPQDSPKMKIWCLQQAWPKRNQNLSHLHALKANMNPEKLKFVKITKNETSNPRLLNRIVLKVIP